MSQSKYLMLFSTIFLLNFSVDSKPQYGTVTVSKSNQCLWWWYLQSQHRLTTSYRRQEHTY